MSAALPFWSGATALSNFLAASARRLLARAIMLLKRFGLGGCLQPAVRIRPIRMASEKGRFTWSSPFAGLLPRWHRGLVVGSKAGAPFRNVLEPGDHVLVRQGKQSPHANGDAKKPLDNHENEGDNAAEHRVIENHRDEHLNEHGGDELEPANGQG